MQPHKVPGVKSVLSLLSGNDTSRKLQILIYHRVLESHDPLQPSEPTQDVFRWQMDVVRNHFNVIPLSLAIDQLYSGELPPRAISVTFDDGYADNLTLALPVLKSLDIPATIFVASGFLEGGIMFNDVVMECVRQFSGDVLECEVNTESQRYYLNSDALKRQAANDIIGKIKYLPPNDRAETVAQLVETTRAKPSNELMMTVGQLRAVSAAGVDIGAHTVNHPILKTLDDERASAEIVDNRKYLADILGKPVELFAYPNGVPDQDYARKHAELVSRMGFKAAVSTAPGYSTSATNRFELHRFTPWDKKPIPFLMRLARNYL